MQAAAAGAGAGDETVSAATTATVASVGATASAAVAYAEVFTIGKENTMDYIAQDLDRTFPTLAFFQEEGPMNEQLRAMLETYCFYRPDVGYVQGMSYMAAVLLLYMDPYVHSLIRLHSHSFT